MTDKEFRRLSRRELVDIIYMLQNREKEYQQELDTLHQQLEQRQLRIDQAGSIAEAALTLHQVFEHAQNAADQYLEETARLRDRAQAEADAVVEAARKEADSIISNASSYVRALLAKAKEEAESIRRFSDI